MFQIPFVENVSNKSYICLVTSFGLFTVVKCASKARHTLATKSNSARSILSNWLRPPNVEITFDIWATYLWQKSPAAAFDKIDRVEHVQLWRQHRPQQYVEFQLLPACIYRRAKKSKLRGILIFHNFVCFFAIDGVRVPVIRRVLHCPFCRSSCRPRSEDQWLDCPTTALRMRHTVVWKASNSAPNMTDCVGDVSLQQLLLWRLKL